MKGHDTEGSTLATMGKLCVAMWQTLLWETHLMMITQIMISAKSPWEKEKQNKLPNKQSFPFSIFHQKWEISFNTIIVINLKPLICMFD
jgi:hypothetical protein